MSWVDLGLIGVVAISALIGLARGFTFELLSLAGWFIAWFASIWFAPSLAPHLPFGNAGSALNRGIAYACMFLIVLVLCGLAARAVSALIGATPLRPLDRLLGGAFGVLRGFVLLLAMATVLAYTPLGQTPAWRESTGAIWLNAVLREAIAWLTPGAAPPPPAAASV